MSLSKALKLLFAILLAGWLLWYFGPAHAQEPAGLPFGSADR
jgi:hypothetical protein